MDIENIMHIPISVVAFFGNTLTVLLFVRKSKWLKKTYNCLIFALAVQDIIAAICLIVLPGFLMKQDAYKLPDSKISSLIFCKILWSGFLPFAFGNASVYTCLMLTFDRWLAVVKPLSYKKYEQSRIFAILAILFPWIAGICFDITAPLNVTIGVNINGTFVCSWPDQEYTFKTVFIAIFLFLGKIGVPATFMVIAYNRIIVHMQSSRNRVNVIRNSNERNRQHCALKTLKRITVTALFASTVIIMCWLPNQLYYALSQVQVTKLGTTTHFAVTLLAFSNSCFNPVIYCFSNKEYQREIMAIFRCFSREVHPTRIIYIGEIFAAETTPNLTPR